MKNEFFIRASIGTAAVLGLRSLWMNERPTTAYLMMYHPEGCSANCQFCPQARESQGDKEKLSRIQWPKFELDNVIRGLTHSYQQKLLKRVCLQVLNYTDNLKDIEYIVDKTHRACPIPISLSCYPLKINELTTLETLGVQRVGIPVDGATEEIFKRIKGEDTGGTYAWKTQWEGLRKAIEVFGQGRVSTHLIIGLGETESQAAQFIQRCVDSGILVGLFAFTPIKGTCLENEKQPNLESYRRIQLVRYLITLKKLRIEDLSFNSSNQIIKLKYNKESLRKIIRLGRAFETSGCASCNRPYYNERPGGLMYNFPRPLTENETAQIWQELKRLVNE